MAITSATDLGRRVRSLTRHLRRGFAGLLCAVLALGVLSTAAVAAPAPPGPATVTAVSSSQLRISWAAVSGATSYRVSRGTAPAGPFTVVSTPTSTTVTDSGLKANTGYSYVISAVNGTGTSAPSAVVTARTMLPTPVGLSAVGSASTRVDLSWAATPGATGYEISRSTTATGTFATIGTTSAPAFADLTVAAASTSFYRVRATTGTNGSAPSSRIGATTATAGAVPPVPASVSARGTSASSVSLSWPGSSGATRYTVLRSTTWGGPYSAVATTSATSLSATGQAANTSSYYVVRAANGAGSSGTSRQGFGQTASTSAAPASPTSLGVTATSASALRLTWAGSPGATSYDVLRAPAPGGPFSPVGTATSGSFVNSGLSAGTAYSYVVRARSSAGVSGTSSAATGTPYTIPPTPTGLAAAPQSESAVRLTWNTVPGATSYAVYRSANNAGPFGAPLATVGAPGYTDSGLGPSSTWYYAVQARNAAGSSPLSTAVGATTSADTRPPGPVTQVAASVGPNSVQLSWGNPAAPDHAAVVVRRASGDLPPAGPTDGDEVAVVSAPGSSVTDAGLSSSTRYSYALFARDTDGNLATGTTLTVDTSDADGVVHVAGMLPRTVTWAPGSGVVHVLDGPVVVPAGATLDLAAGTVVKANPGASLEVEGTLRATGRPGGAVVLDALDAGTGPDDVSGDWGGIRVRPGGTASLLGVRVSTATTALTVDHATAVVHGDLSASRAGVAADDTSTVDATMVDWGDPSGPAPTGSGRSASGAGVTVLPWTGYAGPPDLPPVTPLPFDRPVSTAPGAGPRLAFAHYFTPFPASDNKPVESDYYTTQWLTTNGESGKHAAYGGYLRDRPIPRAPITGGPGPADTDLVDMQTEVRQAISGGLDGYSVDLLSADPANRHYGRVLTMLDAADSVDPGFRILLMPDMDPLRDLDNAGLAALIQRLAQSPAAFRLPDGRLVVSPYKAENRTPAWWSETFRVLKATAGIDVAFVPLFHNWRANAAAFAPISYGFSDWGNRSPATNASAVRNAPDAHAMGKLWMQPVSVQDERPSQGIYDEAGNTENLRVTWQAAIDGGADWVHVPTWNDYAEGTTLAPSVHHGRSFLDLSAWFLTRWKTGNPPEVVRDTVYVTHRVQPFAAKPTYPQTKLMTLRGGSTPARNTVEVVSVLTAPATVTVTVGGQITSYEAPSGFSAKLVPLALGSVAASAQRDGTVVASVSSPWQVTATPFVQDQQYVGVSSAG